MCYLRCFLFVFCFLLYLPNSAWVYADEADRHISKPLSLAKTDSSPSHSPSQSDRQHHKSSKRTSVWRVSKGDRYLYIGGTVHILAASDYPLPQAFDTAYQQSQKLFFEVDVKKLQSPEMQMLMISKSTFQNGQTLKTVLSPKTYQQLESALSQRGVPIASMMSLKPGVVMMTLTLLELQRLGLFGEGVDAYYEKKAKQDGKPLGFLETVEKQIDLITSLGEGREDDLMLYTLNDLNHMAELMAELKRAWREGLSELFEAKHIGPFKEHYPNIYNEMLTDRNQKWVPQIKKMLEDDPVEFVLVGALHLYGEESVINMLEQQGYQVSLL